MDTAFLGGLETTYDVHLGLDGKRVVDVLAKYIYRPAKLASLAYIYTLVLVLIELFSLGVTAEGLRAKIDRK